MSDDKTKPVDALRRETLSALAALTPAEAKALRARFGLEPQGPGPDADEAALRSLAQELAMRKKQKP
jgi:hypothetical protein